MISPDPRWARAAYPLLLASGETANGVDPLVDRQHPHDFFMELSASISQNIGPKSSVLFYVVFARRAGVRPARLHASPVDQHVTKRQSASLLDSTHITFGVVTAGLVHDNFKVELSRFNGREPDQHR